MQINSISDIKSYYKHISNNALLYESICHGYIPGIRLAKIKNGCIFLNDNYYLKLAAYLHHINVCKYLIKLGLKVDNRVLSQALINKNDDIEIVKTIMNYIEVINIKNHTFNEILKRENYKIFYYLVENGYAMNYISYIKDEKIKCKIYQLIRKYKINLLIMNKNYTQLLISSIQHDNVNNVKLAIENGADIHYSNDDALYRAVKNNNVKMLKLLIENGMSFNENDNTYLIKIAAKNGYLDCIIYMIEQNIDIHCDNELSLIYSFINKHYDVFLYLVNHGANIDNCNVYAENKIPEMKQYLRNNKLNNLYEK